MQAAMRRKPRYRRQQPGALGQGWASLPYPVRLPFELIGRLLLHTLQVVLSIFIGILHPSFRWLVRLLRRSALVRNYLSPLLRHVTDRLWKPYFTWLRGLPPYWAALSIALPLAILEPAKTFATILITQQPRTGLVLLLFLHGLSFVLIDKTWTAVRPQARKIRLVARVHAWGWLMVFYGKHWITSSPAYQAMLRLVRRVRGAAQAFWSRHLIPRRRRHI